MKCSTAQIFFDQMFREGDRFDNEHVMNHIKKCNQCRYMYTQWFRIAQKLTIEPALKAPPTLYRSVIFSIENNTTIPIKKDKPWFTLPQLHVCHIPIAIVAFLLIVIGVFFLLRFHPADAVPDHVKAIASQGIIHQTDIAEREEVAKFDTILKKELK